jgi:hypothetical protein
MGLQGLQGPMEQTVLRVLRVLMEQMGLLAQHLLLHRQERQQEVVV